MSFLRGMRGSLNKRFCKGKVMDLGDDFLDWINLYMVVFLGIICYNLTCREAKGTYVFIKEDLHDDCCITWNRI